MFYRIKIENCERKNIKEEILLKGIINRERYILLLEKNNNPSNSHSSARSLWKQLSNAPWGTKSLQNRSKTKTLEETGIDKKSSNIYWLIIYLFISCKPLFSNQSFQFIFLFFRYIDTYVYIKLKLFLERRII